MRCAPDVRPARTARSRSRRRRQGGATQTDQSVRRQQRIERTAARVGEHPTELVADALLQRGDLALKLLYPLVART